MAGEDVLALTQRDRDRLKELHAVIRRRQTVAEAARARSLFQVKFVHNVARLGETPAGWRWVKPERERAPG